MTDTYVSKAHIQTELAATRADWYKLLEQIPDSAFDSKTGNPAWNVKQLLHHIVQGFEYLPKEVQAAQKRRNLLPMPQWFYDRAIIYITRITAIGCTRDSLCKRYEKAYATTTDYLDNIQDDQWHNPLQFFYIETTLEKLFERHVAHFDEHAEQICQGLGLDLASITAR